MGVARVADGLAAIELLRRKFPEAVVDAGTFRDQSWVELRAERLLDCAEWLRDDPGTAFDALVDVTAVHWPDREPPIEIVIHLYSYPRNDRLRIKVRTGETGPVPSLSGIWRAADWNERETYDMFGVRFEGHPDLRRILMPDDYTDFPLRKEFPLYRG
jgi:NADH-quinone oxidoreductase subunit C